MKPKGLVGTLVALKGRMERAQADLEARVFDGRAAGGAVTLALTGKGELRDLTIDPQLLTEGAETVAAIVMAAYADAATQKEKAAAALLREVGGAAANPFGFLSAR